MYGLNGNSTALEWAEEFGLFALREEDQKALVASGHYTSDGQRIYADQEKDPDLSNTSTRSK